MINLFFNLLLLIIVLVSCILQTFTCIFIQVVYFKNLMIFVLLLISNNTLSAQKLITSFTIKFLGIIIMNITKFFIYILWLCEICFILFKIFQFI